MPHLRYYHTRYHFVRKYNDVFIVNISTKYSLLSRTKDSVVCFSDVQCQAAVRSSFLLAWSCAALAAASENMRAWGSYVVPMLASASHSARAFVPAASFRGAPLVSRNLRRPLYSNVCNNVVAASGPGPKQQRGLWVVQSPWWRQHSKSVRVVRMSSSSGVVREAQVEAGAGQEWTATKVSCFADSTSLVRVRRTAKFFHQ